MPHHVRFINPPSLPTPPGYSQLAVVTEGELIVIAGQVALDPQGLVVGPGDFAAQAVQVFRDMRTYARLVTRGENTWAERKRMLAEHRARVSAEIALLQSHRRLLSRKLVLDCAPGGLGRARDR